uniref:Cupin type-1 domain-containing protein n=1 Tax=Oryza punctata TaxID=4537 RepID=A0A0E0JZD9_ORYPU
MASMCSIVPLLFLGLLLFFQVSIAQFSFDGSPPQSSRADEKAGGNAILSTSLPSSQPIKRDLKLASLSTTIHSKETNSSHGVYGMALPDCPETFQSVRSPLKQRVTVVGEGQSTRKMWDEHQQLHQFHQGDVIAVPAGVAHWLYNNGDSAMVAFIVIDTNNTANQLNPRRREFLLAGKPTISQRYLYESEQHSTQNIFALVSAKACSLRPLAMRSTCLPNKRGSHHHNTVMFGDTKMALMIKNINNPQAADIFSTRGGRITRVNIQNFPILHIIQMSATRTVLQNNNLLTPPWTMNAHTVMYVTAGEARVQVVDHHGSVYDGQLHQQQILLIPQNFVVAVNALSQGFTWVSFKTNPNAIDSQITGKSSVLGALPVDVVANSYKLSREDSSSLKFNRGDEMAIFVPRHGM